MTRIQFNDRDRLDLEITGYQFPDNDDGDYDSNWLNVRVGVDSRIGTWSVTEPCLLTRELEELVEATGRVADGLLDSALEVLFIEPNLAFGLRPDKDGTIAMNVDFDAECLPPDWPEGAECRLQGWFSGAAIADIRDGLARDLKRYPYEVGRTTVSP